MKIRNIILALIAALFAMPTASAQKIMRKALVDSIPEANEMVIVGNDTVPLVIPERNLGRYDRGLYNYLFIPRGKWAFGITASYGSLDTDEVQVLSLLKDINFQGKIYSVNPYLSYFFRNNQSLGLRFNYSRGHGDLGSLAMDFDEDLNFEIRDVSYYTQSFSSSLFYRNYIGLNRSKRFGIFNEVDITVGNGSSRFKRIYDSKPKDTKTTITTAALNFSPGVCVFIQEFVSFNVSFGVFGLHMRKEHQVTDFVDEGSRFYSGANFRFNIFNIKFGMMVVI